MTEEFTKPLSLRDEMFRPAIQAADDTLQALIRKMREKKLKEGSISLTLKISLQDTTYLDRSTGELVDGSIPDVTYKAGYSYKDGESTGGAFAADGAALVETESGYRIALLPEDQTSLFD